MAGVVKRGKLYYWRGRYGDRETWICTHKTTEREALKAAQRIQAMFQREKESRQLADALLEVAKQLANHSLTIDECRPALQMLEMAAMREALKVIDELIPAPALLASDLWEKYMRNAPELKASTLQTKKQRFNRFAEWAGERDMREMSDLSCRRFLDTLNGSPQTRNNYISELSSVWKASPELNNPWTENLRQKARNAHKKPFTREQVKTLICYCAENNLRFWHSAILLAYYTGLRLKDVVMFRRDQITSDGYIDLIPEKTARNKKHVRIPINPQLRTELQSITSIGPDFFPEQVRLYNSDRSKITTQFRNILEKSKLYAAGYGFHSLRHTFVTEALNAGIDIKQVQAAVGHEAIEITEGTYYHGEKHADLSAYPTL